MSTGSATYVYCLVARAKRPRLTGVPAGLPGTGPVRLLDVDPGRYLVVADAPLSRYGEKAIQRGLSDLAWISRAAVAHEGVVESFIDAIAVLPMKLFTLFTSDDRAIAHLHRDRRRIDRLMKRLGNHLEWGVRLVLAAPGSGPRVRPRGQTPSNAAAAAQQNRRGGLAYLTQKKAQREQARERVQRARAFAAELYDRLLERSGAAQRRPAGELLARGGPLVLDAAFLVPRRKSHAFRALVRRKQHQLARRGYDLTITGPWPPYSFVGE